MSTSDRYGCADCQRTDLTITGTSKLRKHTADGRRRSDDNPYCPGTEPEGPRPVADMAPDAQDPDGPGEEPSLCEFAVDGVHVYAYGECVCGLTQPGYVPPPEPSVGADAPPKSWADGFLMSGQNGGLTAMQHADAMDAIMAEDAPGDGTDRLYKNGRYALPDPVTNGARTWTRATTMAETVSDLYSLNLWRIRMVIIGLLRHPELMEELVALDQFDRETGKGKLDPKTHKDVLNKIGGKAQALAGAKVPANWGTELHWCIERLSRDEITVTDVPEKYRDEVAAWAAGMQEHGLSAVPHLIERRIAVPVYGTAGTLDQIDRNHRTRTIRLGSRVVRIKAGEHLVGDVKTGRDLDYAWGEIAIQMSIYAQGLRQGKVARWDPEADDGEGAWVWEDCGIDPKTVRDDVGVVFHMPIGSKQCTMHWIDLAEGWKAVQLCDNVRDWRKIKGLNTPFSIAEVPTEAPANRPTVRAPSWRERFSAVTTREQASALYREYLAAGGKRGPALDQLVALAKDHMRQLTESTA